MKQIVLLVPQEVTILLSLFHQLPERINMLLPNKLKKLIKIIKKSLFEWINNIEQSCGSYGYTEKKKN
jgi:hypothetical protein